MKGRWLDMASFACDICGKTFAQAKTRNRHQMGHITDLKCGLCEKTFKRLDNLREHEKTPHKVVKKVNVVVECEKSVNEHNRETVGDVIHEIDGMQLKCWSKASDGYLQSYFIKPTKRYNDMIMFLKDARMLMRQLVNDRRGVKAWICVKAKLEKLDGEEADVHVSTRQMVMLPGTDVDEVLDKAISDLAKKFEEKQDQGFGWMLKNVLFGDVHLSKYLPLRGSTYIDLPKWIKEKKAVLNVKNSDDKCFVWSVLADMYEIGWGENANRVEKYKQYESELNMNGIEFPMTLQNLGKFENQNEISVNVYGVEMTNIIPLYISAAPHVKFIHLLLYKNHFV